MCKGSAVSGDFGWRELLERVSADVVEAGEFEESFWLAVAERRLRSPGASEEALAASEVRLGVKLPQTYRAFL